MTHLKGLITQLQRPISTDCSGSLQKGWNVVVIAVAMSWRGSLCDRVFAGGLATMTPLRVGLHARTKILTRVAIAYIEVVPDHWKPHGMRAIRQRASSIVM